MKKKIAVFGNGWAYEFIISVLNGIKEALKDTNTDIYYFSCYKFHNPDNSLNKTGYKFFDSIELTDFDGIILFANLFEDEDCLSNLREKILKNKIPAVSLVKKVDGLPHIFSNNYDAFFNLINHLIEVHKVTKLGFIGGVKNDIQSDQRYKAFITALKNHNLAVNEEFIISETDWTYKEGLEYGRKLLNNPDKRPQAIVCSNDSLAFGVLHAADEYNLSVPDEIKVIGFDNSSLSDRLIPSITTVSPNSSELGKKAVEILFSSDFSEQEIEIQSTPIFRQSCGCMSELTKSQTKYGFRQTLVQDEEERFSTHLRHTEDMFLNDNIIHKFWENCQNFYFNRHEFEGDNFALMLKKELTQSVLYQDISFNNTMLNNEMQVFVNISNGKKISPSVINNRELVPPNFLSNENSIFCFIPFVYHDDWFGYSVTKNNFKLIFNKRGYTWAKNISNSIQKFMEKTKYRLLSQKYLELSTKDALSGIYNRAALEQFANKLFENNKQNNLQTLISFIDINNLKKINDKYGHLHGDLAIKIVAEEIKDFIPAQWIPVRYGGDEFVIIGTLNENEKIDFLEKLNEKIQIKKDKMSLPYDLSISIGTKIVSPDSKIPLQEEINNADSIMYQNKQKFHQEND